MACSLENLRDSSRKAQGSAQHCSRTQSNRVDTRHRTNYPHELIKETAGDVSRIFHHNNAISVS